METRIKYIGLIDKDGKQHGVQLHEGLNIVTGRSSTGKSALIEIFDYCMGADVETIPKGVITDHARMYFVLMTINGSQWVLGHSQTEKGAYYLQLDDQLEDEKGITLEYFNESNLMRKADYRKQLGFLFGLNIPNTQEKDDEAFTNRTKGRPSVRNMMSYVLQHQNLVANKLALFYRFDEKEKKEQVIEQFKIFAGFVDAEYFTTSVRIDKIKKEIGQLEKSQDFEEKTLQNYEDNIDVLLQQYKDTTNKDMLGIGAASYIMTAARKVKEEIQQTTTDNIQADSSSEVSHYISRYRGLQAQRNQLHASIRQVQLEIQDYEDTIKYVNSYKHELESARFVNEAKIDYSICPFCKQHTHLIEDEVKQLYHSIGNLNEKIRKAPLLGDEMFFKKEEAEERMKGYQKELHQIDKEIVGLKKIIDELRHNRSLEEQGYKKMLELEGFLDAVINLQDSGIDKQLAAKRAELSELESAFNKRYRIKTKMESASKSINNYLEVYRKDLSFEPSLDGYKLKFNLNNFELTFEKGEEKLRLRQIGSGRNWLNAHLCLFLSLSHFFATNVNSNIPSLLFIDQPSQVYFPTKDNYDQFNAKDMWERKEGSEVNTEEERDRFNQDLEDVTNIFNTLYKFAQSVNNKVQIIVTEHADKLDLKDVNFDDLVAARWRLRGQGLITGLDVI